MKAKKKPTRRVQKTTKMKVVFKKLVGYKKGKETVVAGSARRGKNCQLSTSYPTTTVGSSEQCTWT